MIPLTQAHEKATKLGFGVELGGARSPKQVIVDLGYRGVDADNPGVQIIHRGKYKSLSDHEKRLLKRRQAIEPLIARVRQLRTQLYDFIDLASQTCPYRRRSW